MSHAEVCPVCRGAGKIIDHECHGCHGNGWVTVGVDYYPPPYPATPSSPWWGGYPYTWITCMGGVE